MAVLESIHSYRELAESIGRSVPDVDRPVVCIQGLGFAGIAMATAVANARDTDGNPHFNIVGIELPTSAGRLKVEAINRGRLPIVSNDADFAEAFHRAFETGNFVTTTEPVAYTFADITTVNVSLDVIFEGAQPTIDFSNLQAAIRTLGTYMPPGSLIMVETTVPPGTCEKVIAPEIAAALATRGLPNDALLLAHSYERVMPGKDYLRSIINFWRVYAGSTPEAADACEAFLSKVINVKDYPLTRLHSTTASETAKVLENSYRAVNIAFIEEWGRFSEAVGIDMFEVLDAIRMRPTHNNIRKPGFGVGGYCLTKDPLLAYIAARELFGFSNLDFSFSKQAVEINKKMPLVSLGKLRSLLGGSLHKKTLLLLGVSYLQDVGDTRSSPSELFVTKAEAEGAHVICHDPLVEYWEELDRRLSSDLPTPHGVDAVIFAVPHQEYRELDLPTWLNGASPLIFDANNVLTHEQLASLSHLGCRVASIGRGA